MRLAKLSWIGLLFLGKTLSAGNFVDVRGASVEHIDINFGYIFAHQKQVKSLPIEVKYVGDTGNGLLKGNIANCFIDNTQLFRGSVKILIDGGEAIAIQKARDFFSLQVHLKNTFNLEGLFRCQVAQIEIVRVD